MVEHGSPGAVDPPRAGAGSGAPEPPLEGRGRTIIDDHVLETLAARIALDVPGVVRHQPGPDALASFNQALPSATAESAGERVMVRLEVAVAWGSDVRDVAAQVRQAVGRRLSASTGKVVDRVDVTVTSLVSRRDEEATTRRVR